MKTHKHMLRMSVSCKHIHMHAFSLAHRRALQKHITIMPYAHSYKKATHKNTHTHTGGGQDKFQRWSACPFLVSVVIATLWLIPCSRTHWATASLPSPLSWFSLSLPAFLRFLSKPSYSLTISLSYSRGNPRLLNPALLFPLSFFPSFFTPCYLQYSIPLSILTTLYAIRWLTGAFKVPAVLLDWLVCLIRGFW